VFAVPALALSGASLAHTPATPAEDHLDLWALDLAGVALLLSLAMVYALGQARLRSRSRADHTAGAAFFWGGWAALVLALTPPIDTLSGVSFAVHMTQHEIMMLVAAPLLVISRPLGTLLWGSPRFVASIMSTRALREAGAWFTAPLVAWITHAVVLWGWHVPALFEASLRSTLVHWLQHASFFAAAAIYWWSLFGSARAERRGIALLSVFTTAVHTTVLGTLLTFSTTVWYPTYARVDRPWVLTAIEDQQLGGLIMWVPGGMVFLVAGLALAALWLKESEVRALRG
jgi:cytochrome c oxidase assembly factor CtaG